MKGWRSAGLLTVTAFGLLGWCFRASAETPRPLWEIGVGLAGLSLPQYIGSDERYQLALPLPYMIYRGRRVKVDRGGMRLALLGGRRLTLDASFSGGFPVGNSNRARAGMPPLRFSFQAGPRLNLELAGDQRGGLWLLRLPVRGSFDTAWTWQGWLFEPQIQWRRALGDEGQLRATMGALFASSRWHRIRYSVPQAYATPTRPPYEARAGLNSWSASLALSVPIDRDYRLLAALGYRNLSGSVVADSPLVRSRHYVAGVVGLAWIFWRSDELSEPDVLEDQ